MAANDISRIMDILKSPEYYYLSRQKGAIEVKDIPRKLTVDDMYFVKVKSITFEDDAPRREALANVLSAMRFPTVHFVYLIVGDRSHVTFYYGVTKNLYYSEDKAPQNIKEIGGEVLRKGIEGNFRGSSLEIVEDAEAQRLKERLAGFKEFRVMEGVPGLNEDDAADFQGVDRLIDVMLGDEFAFLVTAQNLPITNVMKLEDRIFDLYQILAPESKSTIQKSKSEGVSSNATTTLGTNTSDASNTQQSTSTQRSTSTGQTTGHNYGNRSDDSTSSSKTGSESNSSSSSDTTGNSHSAGSSESRSKSQSKNEGKSSANTTEHVMKDVYEWMNYIDDPVLPRIDYGKGKGVFVSTISLLAQNDVVLQKLVNTTTALFSGERGNKIPLKSVEAASPVQKKVLLNMQIPIGSYVNEISGEELMARSVLSQFSNRKTLFLGNWMTVKELGIVAGLPKKEVVGLSLNEEVEFGLNCNTTADSKNVIPLGSLVKSGTIQNAIKVSLDRRDLSKHIFVCGATGSGKTTTCMGLLKNSGMPFLVIEPAKTEYRILANKEKDVLVFTLGKDSVAPFRLNPLEFLPGEQISSHVDMLMASITAAFEMEAAIPQIIESSLYECYKKYGWDVNTSKNSRYDNPFASGVYSFPILSDLIEMIDRVVAKQGFSDRLKGDYLGSIKARLLGLVVGAKGTMLNTRRSIDFRTLIHKKVILELENVKSVSEKSLIMGFILSSLNEAIKLEYQKNPSFNHITLVEEAHRLLSRFTPGDSLNKKNGVEMFADMLAEIRKYGECLIIADQIPDKMTPEVLKNTNTKIVHKIFAQDDKNAIGNTMSLTDEQKAFLSNLSIGRAVVFSQGWEKSIQVQVDQVYDTTNEHIEEGKLRDVIMDYYAENYQSGVFPELALLDKRPSRRDVERILESGYLAPFVEEYRGMMRGKGTEKRERRLNPINLVDMMNQLLKDYSIQSLGSYLAQMCYDNPTHNKERLIIDYLKDAKKNNLPDEEEFCTKYKELYY